MTGLLAVAATLALAAALAAGARARRLLAGVVAAAGLAWPLLCPAALPLLDFLAGLLAFWGLVRVVQLGGEQPPRALKLRLWHAFALFDTRAAVRVPPHFDGRCLAAALLYLAVGATGVGLVLLAARLGPAHTPVRWLGGAAFVYGAAVGVGTLIPFLYLLGGVAVPEVQATPVAARSLAEFWGQRWNRVVGRWLHDAWFRPLARRGRPATGVFAAFTASAVMHAYVAAVAGGLRLGAAMGAFFLVQGGLVLLERALRIDRWSAWRSRLWFLAAMAASLPLFLEPTLAIFVPGIE